MQNKIHSIHDSPSTIVDMVKWRAQNRPDNIAFTFLFDGETEGQNLTYKNLDFYARCLAAKLQKEHKVGERALLLFFSEFEFLVAFFGCLYAGIVAIPAFPPKLNRHNKRLHTIFLDAQATIILTTSNIYSHRSTMFNQEQLIDDISNIDVTNWICTDSITQCKYEDNLNLINNFQKTNITQENLAYLQYTSGSTVEPKGVMITHENIMHNEYVIKKTFEYDENSTFVSWLPLFHDMGLIGGVMQPIFIGARCILMPPFAFLQKPVNWLNAISKYKAYTTVAPNFAYDYCIHRIKPDEMHALNLSNWQVAINGSEPISSETLNGFVKKFAPYGFKKETFYPSYGLAESTLLVSGNKKKNESFNCYKFNKFELEKNFKAVKKENDNLKSNEIVECGKFLDSNIKIVNPLNKKKCNKYEVGEVWVASSSVAKGYWKKEEETKKTFKAYIKDTNEGPFVRTGDLGFIYDEKLFITGRFKDLIIIRGRNYYPHDIERSACKAHSLLRMHCSAAFSVSINKEESLVIVQEIQPNYNEDDLDYIIALIRQAVEKDHELSVFAIVLVKKATIPKTSSGKIKHQECKKRFLENKLDIVQKWLQLLTTSDNEINLNIGNRETLLQAPIDQQQKLLESYLQTWVQSILKIDHNLVKVDWKTPLDELGMDSLKEMDLRSIIENNLNIVFPSETFIENFNIEKIANIAIDLLYKKDKKALYDNKLADDPLKSLPISKVSRKKEIPLSYEQERLWFIHELDPTNTAYNLIEIIKFKGNFNVNCLEQAFNIIIKRHEILRTYFPNEHGKPISKIKSDIDFKVQFIDLTHVNNKEKKISYHYKYETHKRFNFKKPPLFRSKVLKIDENEHILIFSIHHIIFDGWSLGVFWNEVGNLYTSLVTHSKINLPELPIQYADFAYWERKILKGDILQNKLDYWAKKFQGELPIIELPTDYHRPAKQTYKGKREYFSLSNELITNLKKLSHNENTTLFITLLTAYKILLYRYTNQEDMIVGIAIANRYFTQVHKLIGFFVNMLGIRTSITGDSTFNEYLHQVSKVALEAYNHQDFPFEVLVEKLKIQRELSHNPLFQVAFSYQGNFLPDIKMPDLSTELIEIDPSTALFDLTLSTLELKNQLRGYIEYNSDLFKQSTVKRMVGHYITLLEGVVKYHKEKISKLPLITQEEKKQILQLTCGSKVKHPQDKCVHQIFEEQVKKFPNNIAVVYNDQRITYIELNEKANQVAHYLQKFNVKSETFISIAMGRSVELIVGILGILKSGGAYVPINPHYPDERIEFILKDTNSKILLSEKKFVEKFSKLNSKLICLDSDWDNISLESKTNPTCLAQSNNTCYVIYTSGSTGMPKGVVIVHQGVKRLFKALDFFGFSETDIWTLFHSITFDFSVWEIFGALLHGGKLIVLPYETCLSPNDYYTLLHKENVTVLNQTPTSFFQLVEAEKYIKSNKKLKLRYIFFGGEKLEIHKLADYHLKHLKYIPKLINLYGPTELTVASNYFLIPDKFINKYTSSIIGKALNDLDVFILDKYLNMVPIGVIGEIYIAGDGLAKGYLNRPNLTKEKFIKNPYSDGEDKLLYKTGDLARYLADGNIEFIGRTDDQVKIHGFRIELGEIENVILQLNEIENAVVVVAEDSTKEKYLVSYIQFTNSFKEKDSNQLRETLYNFLKQKLPLYMIPSVFMFIDKMPLTTSNKLDYHALPEPDLKQITLTDQVIPPANEFEEKLVEIWIKVLHVGSISTNDNFFAIGGNSIKIVQIVREAETYNIFMEVKDILENQTIKQLSSKLLSSATKKKIKQIPFNLLKLELNYKIPKALETVYPLSKMQEYIIHYYNKYKRGSYHSQLSFRLYTKNFSIKAFEKSINYLIEKHPVLRTIFIIKEGKAIAQGVRKEMDFNLHSIDIKHLVSDEQESYINQYMKDDRKKTFDLSSKDPLFRITIFFIAEDQVEMFMSVHHAIYDGWGNQKFLSELFELYRKYNNNEFIPNPQPDFTYKEFIAIEKETILSKKHKKFWKEHLKNNILYNKAKKFKSKIKKIKQDMLENLTNLAIKDSINSKITKSIKELSYKLEVSLKSIYLSALVDQIALKTGGKHVTIGVVSNGRSQRLTNPIGAIGLFWNIIPFSTMIENNKHLQIQNIHNKLNEMELYNNYPLPEILEATKMEDLFFATYNFLNFGNTKDLMDDDKIRIASYKRFDKFHFPINYSINLDTIHKNTDITIEYDHNYFDEFAISNMHNSYKSSLTKLLIN